METGIWKLEGEKISFLLLHARGFAFVRHRFCLVFPSFFNIPMEVQELKAIVRPLAACLKTEVVKYQFKAYCDMEDYLWIFLPYTEFKTPCPEAISKRIYCMCVCLKL